MAGFNISSLFGGFKSSGGFSSINFSDYSMIRSGAYKKLMKSYYAQDKKSGNSKSEKTNEKKGNIPVDRTGLTQLKTEADSLKTAAQSLSKADLWEENDTEKIAKAVKNFAKEYNDVITQTGKTSSKDAAQNVQFMNGMTNTMSKALSKVGITVGADGKLSVDEEALGKADTSNIKSLFSGASSYGAQIEKYAGNVASAAVRDASVYTNSGNLNSSFSSMFNKWI